MNYKLIKLTEGYIIVSDEKIVENNKAYNSFNNTICNIIPLFSSRKILENPLNLPIDTINSEHYFKIIASNFIPELPNIDFNNLEEKFGIVDWKKYFDLDNSKFGAIAHSYYLGFNKCLSINKDKLYKEEDMYKLLDECKTNAILSRNLNFMESRGRSFIQSLQPKIEFEIEIEQEEYSGHDFTGMPCVGLLRPKITDNKIKITKIC